jgi:hypothetical protein
MSKMTELASGAITALRALLYLVGAVLGVARNWDNRLIGAVLGFGAGALISSVSFELVEEGLQTAGGLLPTRHITDWTDIPTRFQNLMCYTPLRPNR